MNMKKMDFPDRELFILADGDWGGYRSHACSKEPETVAWLRRVAPGSVVWDVGASVGPYSLVAAALGAKKVVAFEPQAASYGHLWHNTVKNFFTEVIMSWPIALNAWDAPVCGIFPTTLPMSHMPGAGSYGAKTQQPVITMSADTFMALAGYPWPDHIKIDVDGAEQDVIEGGRTVWAQAQSVMVEASEKTIEDIAVILSGCGLEQTGKWFRSGVHFNYLFERAQ